MSATVVRVGDVVFDSEAEVGFTIRPGGFTGWTDPVPARRPSGAAREGQHGDFDEPVHLQSRVMSVSGKCWSRNAYELEEFGILLAGLGADGGRFPVEVTHAGRTLWAWARRGAAPRFEESPALGYAEYEFDFWMPSPFKYGDVRESVSAGDSVNFGNVAAAHHRGNTDALPRFTVTATSNIGAVGYQLKGKGRTFEVPGPLNVGQTDEVDFRSRTVRRDGVLVTGVVPRVFAVGGGESVDWRFWPLSGAGAATMHLLDTNA